MPAVNWDQPSTGLVSDPNPSLVLENDKGGALVASSEQTAVEAESNAGLALNAHTKSTLTARIQSESSAGMLVLAPKSIAALGANQAGVVAVGGLSAVDPAIPNPTQNQDGIGVAGLTNRFAATGVAGVALGPRSYGVRGEAESGTGVRGIGTQAGVEGLSAESNGVRGITFSGASAGVFGIAAAGGSSGVRAQAIGGPGVATFSQAGPGVLAQSDKAEGVVAEAKASNAAGVRAKNDHSNGFGVDGSSQQGTAIRGITSGGTAVVADAFGGRAVDASNYSTTNPAIEAFSLGAPGVDAIGNPGVKGASLFGSDPNDLDKGAGVSGLALGGSGVVGATLTGTGVLGVGHALLGAWAGVFRGNVFIDGMLFKQASFFSIDHPLDPKRKVLNHAAVESPDHKTFYDGTVELNTRGEARVKLPKWFAALNDKKTLCYQLTPIGGPAPNLHVAAPFDGSQFVIAGGQARQQVSWQVTGTRIDAFAKANPVVVEQKRSEARPTAPEPSRRDMERLEKALRTAAAGRDKSAKSAKEALEKIRFPATQKPESVAEPEGGLGAVAAAAKKLYAVLERLKSA
jgi:hypothetical protein